MIAPLTSPRTARHTLQYKARSCEGLSIYLFLFSVLGNTTYVTAIILGHLHDRNTATLVANVPYIVGSAGTLVFDVVIFLQFFAYRGERRGYVAVQDGEEVGEDEATK